MADNDPAGNPTITYITEGQVCALAGRSRAWLQGRRRLGGSAPTPAAKLRDGTRLYSEPDVRAWLQAEARRAADAHVLAESKAIAEAVDRGRARGRAQANREAPDTFVAWLGTLDPIRDRLLIRAFAVGLGIVTPLSRLGGRELRERIRAHYAQRSAA